MRCSSCDGLAIIDSAITRGLDLTASAGVLLAGNQLSAITPSAASCDQLTAVDNDFSHLTLTASPGATITGNRFRVGRLAAVGCDQLAVVGNDFNQTEVSVPLRGASIVLTGVFTGALLADNRLDGPDGTSDAVAILIETGRLATVTRCAIHDTVVEPIGLRAGANDGVEPPLLSEVSRQRVAGTAGAPDGSRVELYADPAGSMARYVGEATVSAGAFTFDGLSLMAGEQVRATITDPQGNTSAASNRLPVP